MLNMEKPSVNQRVKELRKSIHMTMEQFGNRLGVSKSAISQIERGRTNVTEQMRKSICREYDVSPLWLDTGEGLMFNNNNQTYGTDLNICQMHEHGCIMVPEVAREQFANTDGMYFKAIPYIEDDVKGILLQAIEDSESMSCKRKQSLIEESMQPQLIKKFDKVRMKPERTSLVICSCTDDNCTEPTKKKAGSGSQVVTEEMAKSGIQKHVNFYKCDNKNCSIYKEIHKERKDGTDGCTT